MAACGQGQQPYQAEYDAGGIAWGDSPQGACNALSAFYSSAYSDGSYIVWDASASRCTGYWDDGGEMYDGAVTVTQICGNDEPVDGNAVINCTGACAVTLKLAPADSNPQHIQDVADLTLLFLAAGIAILCLRKLAALFTVPHEKD